ncbi:MAG: hypothetical protein KDI53_11225 [Candidatus Accumulibacter sp.]|nr:hypothetical protein [Accumulibacter sp.]
MSMDEARVLGPLLRLAMYPAIISMQDAPDHSRRGPPGRRQTMLRRHKSCLLLFFYHIVGRSLSAMTHAATVALRRRSIALGARLSGSCPVFPGELTYAFWLAASATCCGAAGAPG